MITIEAIQTGLQVPVPKAWSFNSDEASAKETAEIKKLLEGFELPPCAGAPLEAFRSRPGQHFHPGYDSRGFAPPHFFPGRRAEGVRGLGALYRIALGMAPSKTIDFSGEKMTPLRRVVTAATYSRSMIA